MKDGGKDELENYQALCQSCNLRKSCKKIKGSSSNWVCAICGKSIDNHKYGGRCRDCNIEKMNNEEKIIKEDIKEFFGFIPKGKYIIWEEDGEIWSTNSPFWKRFFR